METNIFEELDNNVESTEKTEVKVENSKKGLANPELAKAKAILNKDLHEDPTLKDKIRTACNSIEVINTLAFGESGGLVTDKEAMAQANDGKRKVQGVSKIIGYKIKNIGEEPIKYRTSKWTLDEATGVFVENKVEKTLAPGEVANLSRLYITMLGARPEFSNKFANGKLVKSSSSAKVKEDLVALLESYHFVFSPVVDENGNETKKEVHGADVKISISKKNEEGKDVVIPEYEEDFGFLNNAKAKNGGKKRGGKSVNAQDAMAYMVYKAIQESNL